MTPSVQRRPERSIGTVPFSPSDHYDPDTEHPLDVMDAIVNRTYGNRRGFSQINCVGFAYKRVFVDFDESMPFVGVGDDGQGGSATVTPWIKFLGHIQVSPDGVRASKTKSIGLFPGVVAGVTVSETFSDWGAYIGKTGTNYGSKDIGLETFIAANGEEYTRIEFFNKTYDTTGVVGRSVGDFGRYYYDNGALGRGPQGDTYYWGVPYNERRNFAQTRHSPIMNHSKKRSY